MTDIDTALLDATIEAIAHDTPLHKAFANSISLMGLEVSTTTERQAQIRQMNAKLEVMTRPARRLSLSRLQRKLLSDDESVRQQSRK